MDTQYENYYSQYEETHDKVNNAYDLACSHGVSKNLQENIANATEKIGRCKIGGENDNVIASYNEVVNSYLGRLNNLYEFATSYFDVESVYCDLALELDELEEYDSQFKQKTQQQPNKSDSKYAITNEDGTPGINYELYYSDLNKWELEVSSYKKCCKTLSDNIQNYIDYLASVNSFDPKDGKIQVSVDRPSYLVGGELLNKYSNEPISGEEMLDDRDIYTRLSDYGYTNVRKLENKELEEYCEKYAIGPSHYWGYSVGHYENGMWVQTDRIWGEDLYNDPKYNINISVYTCEKSVNGVTYSFAFAYDNNKSEAYHREFEDEMEKCVEQMYLIPDYCHKQLQENGINTIVLKESEICDSWAHINDSNMKIEAGNGGGSVEGSVYTNYFPNLVDDHGVFLHELGHQFDKYSTEDIWIKLTEKDNNAYLDEFANGNYKWDDWSVFSDNEKRAKSCEHFAECFRRYWCANDRLKDVCPESYAELERIMQETEKKYQ